MDFQSAKSKNSLAFVELISEFLTKENIVVEEESFPDQYLFLISNFDPGYEDILVYLQTLKCHASFLQEYRHKL